MFPPHYFGEHPRDAEHARDFHCDTGLLLLVTPNGNVVIRRESQLKEICAPKSVLNKKMVLYTPICPNIAGWKSSLEPIGKHDRFPSSLC